MYDVNLITRDDIQALVVHIPYFESGNSFGEHATIENGCIGCSTLSRKARSFMVACYDHHFVQGFDWNRWAKDRDPLVSEGEGIESLNLEEIGKLLTTHCRADRFCDGHLLSVMENGQILRILKRLREIYTQELTK